MNKYFLSLSIATALMVSCSKSAVDEVPQTPEVKVSEGGVVQPKVGGANQPNTVFVSLANNTTTEVKRDSWDLGFYCGNDFKVILNNSIAMAAKELSTTNIDEVQAEDASVVATMSPSNLGYADSPDGNLTSTEKGKGTAIATISANANENKVYLVNLGHEVATKAPAVGSVSLHGASRGWLKIRVTRSGNDYVIDYAGLAETTHKTIKVSKNPDYNFVFVNLKEGKTVNVEPKKADWDIAFTGFTAQTRDLNYYFSDFVLNNSRNDVKVHKVTSTEADRDKDYSDYTKAKASEINFNSISPSQQQIGGAWRNVFKKTPTADIFYVLKDSKGNLFKIKFLAMVNDKGERGYPVFEYKLLQ